MGGSEGRDRIQSEIIGLSEPVVKTEFSNDHFLISWNGWVRMNVVKTVLRICLIGILHNLLG